MSKLDKSTETENGLAVPGLGGLGGLGGNGEGGSWAQGLLLSDRNVLNQIMVRVVPLWGH